MKTVIGIVISIMFCMLPVAVCAQETGNVTVELNTADIKGRALNLDLDVKINHIYIGKRESLSLTLALKKGNDVLYLPPVIINGSNKRKMYERAVNLYGLEAAKGGAYAVLKNDQDLIQFLPYTKSIPYKSWMNRSQLLLIGEVLDYNNNVIDSFTDVLEKSLRITNAAQRTKKTTQPQSGTPAQPTDKVQQFLMQQQQPAQPAQSAQPTDKVQQFLMQQQKKKEQQETPPPLRYRQGEYPLQQQQQQPQQRMR